MPSDLLPFLVPILIGAAVGFIIGMIAGGAIAGGRITKIEPPYATVEGGTPGCAGVLKQLGIALIGTVIGAVIGAVVGVILAVL